MSKRIRELIELADRSADATSALDRLPERAGPEYAKLEVAQDAADYALEIARAALEADLAALVEAALLVMVDRDAYIDESWPVRALRKALAKFED